MVRYRAAWVLPISGPPIRDGWIVLIGVGLWRVARIVRLRPSERRPGDRGRLWRGRHPAGPRQRAHTSQLYVLRDEIAPASEFVAWVRSLMAERRHRPDPKEPEILDAILKV
jgi:hypothetical protein